jgi:hypothetical protein
LAATLFLPLAAEAQPSDATQLPSDNVTTVNGVKAACTGVGTSEREDPRWKNFAVRFESAAPAGDYLGGVTLAVASDKGAPVVAVSCNSPWLLMDLPPGGYKVTAWSGHRGPKTLLVHASAKAQARYVIVFPKVTSAG